MGVVLASRGYPDSYETGHRVEGLGASGDDCVIFHAGTRGEAGRVTTAGGRVLCVTALGETVAVARERAYERVAGVRCGNLFFRRDIAHRALPGRAPASRRATTTRHN